MNSRIRGALLGHGIGDALGVPVEFNSRVALSNNPVTDYLGYLCWNQPPGTFSDDSSMMYCTVESLCNGYDLHDIGQKFVKWYKEGYWGAHHKVFDIGGTTRSSLDRILRGESPEASGEFFEDTNGNGSLMRILPLIFFLRKVDDIEERYQMVKSVSSITHAHFRSVFSCFIFTELGRILITEKDKPAAYEKMQKTIASFIGNHNFNADEITLFNRILAYRISDFDIDSIRASGYVLHALEASLYCFYTTNNYKDAVLKAVNLGEDTDTTAAITGGLSGLYYGDQYIPNSWIKRLARIDDIEALIDHFTKSVSP